MSDQYIGEIRLFPFNLVPDGWAPCEGQILPIAQNQALYSLLGTTYGGDGQTTFALPDLRGRVPIHVSPSIPLGTKQGEETHVLTQNEMPSHTHSISGSSATGAAVTPSNGVWGTNTIDLYGPVASLAPMNNASLTPAGNSQSHPNMQPYLVLNFYIALNGYFPSRN